MMRDFTVRLPDDVAKDTEALARALGQVSIRYLDLTDGEEPSTARR